MILTDGRHLVSDVSLSELHTFVKQLGFKRKWFQNNLRHPHYDLTTNRALIRAMKQGVKRVSIKELLKRMVKT